MTSNLVTLGLERSGWITGAVFTAESASELPVISFTAITAATKDVRQTDALPGDSVTTTGTAVCTEDVTHARCTYAHNTSPTLPEYSRSVGF